SAPPPEPAIRFDDGILALTRLRAVDAFILQKAFRLLLSARQVAGHPLLERLSRELIGAEAIGHSDFADSAEIRLPERCLPALAWHQDYLHAQNSEDGVTYWAPLHDCGEREGSLCLALGSHKLGILPVRPSV